jgi:hypothetical protein
MALRWFSRRNFKTRSQTGSALMLGLVSMVVVVMILISILAVNGLFVNRTVVQSKAESFALESALKLNQQDNAGRLNLLTAHSRELVFDSRQLSNKVHSQMPELDGLAAKLMEESRDGSKVMEKERELLGDHIVNELIDGTKKFSTNENAGIALPFLGGNMTAPGVYDLEIGDVPGLPSNVDAPKGNPALCQYDDQMGYVQPKLALYKSNVNLKLPAQDSDLNFELSALPARSDQATANGIAAVPASLHKSDNFRRSAFLWKDGQKSALRGAKIPSAIRCIVSSAVKLDAQRSQPTSGKILLDTSAATNGTNPELN